MKTGVFNAIRQGVHGFILTAPCRGGHGSFTVPSLSVKFPLHTENLVFSSLRPVGPRPKTGR